MWKGGVCAVEVAALSLAAVAGVGAFLELDDEKDNKDANNEGFLASRGGGGPSCRSRREYFKQPIAGDAVHHSEAPSAAVPRERPEWLVMVVEAPSPVNER